MSLKLGTTKESSMAAPVLVFFEGFFVFPSMVGPDGARFLFLTEIRGVFLTELPSLAFFFFSVFLRKLTPPGVFDGNLRLLVFRGVTSLIIGGTRGVFFIFTLKKTVGVLGVTGVPSGIIFGVPSGIMWAGIAFLIFLTDDIGVFGLCLKEENFFPLFIAGVLAFLLFPVTITLLLLDFAGVARTTAAGFAALASLCSNACFNIISRRLADTFLMPDLSKSGTCGISTIVLLMPFRIIFSPDFSFLPMLNRSG